MQTMEFELKRGVLLCLLMLCAIIVLSPYAPGEDDDEGPGDDPYTNDEIELMQAAGYERFGPFRLTERRAEGVPDHSPQCGPTQH